MRRRVAREQTVVASQKNARGENNGDDIVFKLDPSTLSDARLQFYWAAQILAATANALMEIQPDDSQSNLAWDETNRAMVGREGASIEFPTFQLISPAGDLYPLLGKTMDDGMNWLGRHVEARLVLRDNEMPSHPVAAGSPFDAKPEELCELVLRQKLLCNDSFAEDSIR